MTTIGEICVREVVTVTREAPVTSAARLMRDNHVGSVVVVDSQEHAIQRPIGIVTDRDIVTEVIALDLDAGDMTVGEVMALGQPLVTIAETASVRETLALMRSQGLRRVPVVGAQGELRGLVSSDDLIEILADDMSALASIATHERARETAQRRPLGA